MGGWVGVGVGGGRAAAGISVARAKVRRGPHAQVGAQAVWACHGLGAPPRHAHHTVPCLNVNTLVLSSPENRKLKNPKTLKPLSPENRKLKNPKTLKPGKQEIEKP